MNKSNLVLIIVNIIVVESTLLWRLSVEPSLPNKNELIIFNIYMLSIVALIALSRFISHHFNINTYTLSVIFCSIFLIIGIIFSIHLKEFWGSGYNVIVPILYYIFLVFMAIEIFIRKHRRKRE